MSQNIKKNPKTNSIKTLEKVFDKLSDSDKEGELGKQILKEIEDKKGENKQAKAKKKIDNKENEITEVIGGAPEELSEGKDENIQKTKKHTEEIDLIEGVGYKKDKDFTSSPFSFSKPIYLQIHRQNIFEIFISGLISPVCYSTSRPQTDIQSGLKEFLQLSNGLLDEIKKDDAIIEISFSGSETKEVKTISSIALLSKPIPVSRIKRIYVTSDFAKTDILATAQTADAGFVPDFLIDSAIPDNIQMIIQDEEIKDQDITKKFTKDIEEFDRVLGAYAFVKNGQLLITNKSNIYSNYSEHYLGFVKLLLQEPSIPIEENSKQLNFYKQLLGLKNQDESPVLNWLFERTKIGTNFTSADISEFGNILLRSHSDENFKEQGKAALNILNDGIKRRTAPSHILKNVEHKDKTYLYLFSFLYIYGNKTAEDRTNSRIGVANDATISYSEFVFTLLGYFYGYSLLRNRDEKQVYTDSTFSKYAQNLDRPIIKFELTTLFDYYLIEAIYQYVFNGSIANGKFEYINPIGLPSGKLDYPVKLSPEYDFMHFEVLGKQFFRLRKKSTVDELVRLLSSLPDDIPAVSEVGLYCIRNDIKMKWNLNTLVSLFSDIKKLRSIATISKSDIIEHIQSGKYKYEDLLQRINNSINYKEHE